MANLVLSREINSFETLLQLVNINKSRWNPKQERLKLEKLQAKLETLQTFHNSLITAQSELTNASKVRRLYSEDMLRLAKRIRNSASLYLEKDAPQLEMLDSLFRQINGRAKENKDKESVNVNKRTTSQFSLTDRIDQFMRLKELMIRIPDYEPEEEELTLTNWEERMESLTKAIGDHLKAQAELGDLRKQREQVKEELKYLESDIKKYLKAIGK